VASTLLSTARFSGSCLPSNESSVASDKSIEYWPKIEKRSVVKVSSNDKSVGFFPVAGT
jgi:hypothetical protein